MKPSEIHFQLEASWRTLRLKPLPGEGALAVLGLGIALPAGEILCGIGSDGLRRLLIPVPSEASVRTDSESGGILIRAHELSNPRGTAWYAEVLCRKPYLDSLFTDFSAAVVEAVAAKPGDAGTIPFLALEGWRALLAESSAEELSEKRLAGLFAELWYLREMCRKTVSALELWTGPDAARHDFVSGDRSIEVKATRILEGRRFHINGIWQLEPPPNGDLHLATMKLELVRDGGESPVDIVRSISALGVNKRLLWDKLRASGYVAEHEPRYQTVRFRILERLVYLVDAEFPAITGNKFRAGQVPPGIARVEYDIELVGEKPRPLKEEKTMRLFEGFVG